MSATLILVGGLNHYQQTFMLTGGGPSHYSETLGTYTYFINFTQKYFGYGSAMAVIVLIIALGLAILMLQATTKQEDMN